MANPVTKTNLVSTLDRYVSDEAEVGRIAVAIKQALGLSNPSDVNLDNCLIVRDHDYNDEFKYHTFNVHFTDSDYLTELYRTAAKLQGEGTLTAEFLSDIYVIAATRGVVVRVPAEANASIISRGYPHTPVLTIANKDDLMPDASGVLRLVDSHGVQHAIPTSTAAFVPRLEGCVIRISLCDDEVLVTTNRKLSITNSRWGSSMPFLEMYAAFGGPEMRTLFPQDVKSSDMTYLFMLVDVDLQIASRYPIGDGFMVYLGAISNSGSGQIVPPVQHESFVPLPKGQIPITGKDGTHAPKTIFTASSSHVDFEGAANILLNGYGKGYDLGDPRLSPGEAIVCHFQDADTGSASIVHINSLGYNWRTSLVNNNPNHRFQMISYYTYVLNSWSRKLKPTHPDGTDLKLVFNGEQEKTYTHGQLFPNVCTLTDEEFARLALDVDALLDAPGPLADRFHAVEGSILKAIEIARRSAPSPHRDGREVKFSNIAMCVVLGFPISHIGNLCQYFHTFVSQRDQTIAAITGNIDGVDRYAVFYEHCSKDTLWELDPEFGTKEKESRAANILKRVVIQAHTHADRRYGQGEMSRGRGRGGRGRGGRGYQPQVRLSLDHLRRDNVRNLLMKEAGNTLYSLMTSISRMDEHAFDKYKKAQGPAALPLPGQAQMGPDDFPALPGQAQVGLGDLPKIAGALPDPIGLPKANAWGKGKSTASGPTIFKPKDNADDDFTL